MANGPNALSLRLWPQAPGIGAVSATVAVHVPGRLDETQRDLFITKVDFGADNPLEGNTPPGSGPGFRIGAAGLLPIEGGVAINRTFELENRVPDWRWLSSERMIDSPDLRTALLGQYAGIWSALSEARLEMFPELLAERTAEYRLATFADVADIPADYGLAGAIAEGRLFDLEPEHAQFRLFGDGRLAEFRRWDDKPMIAFIEGEIGRYFRFVFRRERGAWIVTR